MTVPDAADDVPLTAAGLDADEVVGAGHRAVFARMGRNIGWLLGGRGFGGLASIAYLGIAARALGPAGFGLFALVLAYGSSIANLAQFNSWQAVIRFGAVHRAAAQPASLTRLLGFTATLDAAGALIGAALAFLGVQLAGTLLGWSPAEQQRAALFGAVLLLSTGATATGMLRLFDRFDLLTYAETVGPAARVLGAALAWALGWGIDGFLAVWAVAALAEAAAGWVAALSARLSPLSFGRAAFAAAPKENHRLWRFVLQNNASSSLDVLWEQLGTLAVGAVAGPASAGAFRIATKLAGAIAKPVGTVTRALYPELARLAAGGERTTLRQVVRRVSLLAGATSVLLVGVIWLWGPVLIRVFSGRGFESAQLFLLPLTIAAAIDLCGIAFEPIHNAYGRSGRVLAVRSAGALVYVLALWLLLDRVGPQGAAFAAIASSLAIRGLLAVSTRRMLARSGAESAQDVAVRGT